MGKGIYSTSAEPRSGKSVVVLGIMEMLAGQRRKTGFFRAGEKIIGAGRYIRFGSAIPPDRAEVAFMVEEDYHGLGIASIILRHPGKYFVRRWLCHYVS